MKRMVNAFRAWVPFAVAVTALCALAYATVQQSLRQGANDPQIQMAEDAAAALNAGAKLDAVLPKEQVEISGSLAPFVILYDMEGKPLAGSGILNGKLPDFPEGALEAARQIGENRVTWQPDIDIRIASVVVPYKDGYVMAGRSLREVEKRESQSETYAVLTWLATLPAIFAAIAVFGSGLG